MRIESLLDNRGERMHDESVQYPNRIRLIPVEGSGSVFDYIRIKGDVATEGTPINKKTLLRDETAAKYGLGPEATPDDVFSRSALPRGCIMLWYGDVNTIPYGWAICDGQNGTPDMRGRFALGVGDKYALGATGGEETHTLTIAEMPKHYHRIPLGYYQGGGYGVAQHETGRHSEISDSTGYAGESQPHNIMPPYLALHYIMKL